MKRLLPLARILCAITVLLLVDADLLAHGPAPGKVYVVLWFDTEDYILPESDDAAKRDRKSTRLNSSHTVTSYAVFCLKKNSPGQGAGARPDALAAEPRRRLRGQRRCGRPCGAGGRGADLPWPGLLAARALRHAARHRG